MSDNRNASMSRGSSESLLYHKMPKIVVIFWYVAIFASCNNYNATEILDRAGNIINERPDSALSILRNVDSSLLKKESNIARFSLLQAVALDKCYIDTTDVSVVLPAVKYYSKHGNSDEKLKAYYYLGRIQYNAGDLNAAAVSFSISESYAQDADDVQMQGLLYMAIADIYNKTRNRTKEEEYVEKGIKAFEAAGDVKHSNLSSGRLAIIHYSGQEYHLADSLFQAGIEQAKGDTVAMSVFLSNYARLKVVQPEADPAGAIELLKSLSISYKRPLSLMDYGVWAYASLLLGDNQTCTSIENQLKDLDDSLKTTVLYWLYRIEQHRGNYEQALEYYIESNVNNSKLVDSLLLDSVSQALQSYYQAAVKNSRQEVHILRLRLLLAVLGSCIFFIVAVGYIKYRRDKHEKEVNRLLRIGEESNKLLKQANDELQGQVDLLKQSNGELETTLAVLRKEYVSAYKDKFSAIGELCNAYMDSNNRTDKKDFIVRKVENLIAFISDDDKLHMRFENQINNDLNNIVKHLKADLGDINKKDRRFICYCLVGFEPEMIGSILGMSISNVYTKKSRLKEKIRVLDSPYKEEYLRML